MLLSPDVIKKVARLSRLNVTDQDIVDYQEKFDTIFQWIDQLQAVDVSEIDLSQHDNVPLMHEREDVVTAPNRVVDVLSNAPASMHEMFSVPKVVE